jgi:hypothetical protein
MARHVTCFSVLTLLALGACASSGPEEPAFKQIPDVTYEAPSSNPGAPTRFNVAGSVPEVVGKVVDALNGPRFGITHVDRNRGVVTATFRADPDDYVECGSLITVSSQGEQLVRPAASRRLNYEVPLENQTRIGTVNRSLALDGRLIVKVRASTATMSEVLVEGDYVLSRQASLVGTAGQTLGRSEQLVAFGSGQVAGFGKGDTFCQSNGLLEQKTLAFDQFGNQSGPLAGTLGQQGPVTFGQAAPTVDQAAPTQQALTAPSTGVGGPRGIILNTPEGGPRAEMVRREVAKLPCAPATVIEDPDGRVRVSGLISSQQDLDQLKSTIRSLDPENKVDFQLVVTSPSACEVLTAALPLQRRNGSGSLGGASIGIANGAATLSEGDLVVFDVAAPNFESHLYIMYLQQDGGLVHLLPNRFDPDRLYQANDRFSVGDDPTRPSFTVSPPYGDDLLILVASSTPLFSSLRPQIEDSGTFAAEFADLIAAVEAAGGDIVADLVFLNTSPKSS